MSVGNLSAKPWDRRIRSAKPWNRQPASEVGACGAPFAATAVVFCLPPVRTSTV